MKLQFDANLGYQEQAVFSVVDLFKGQAPMQSNFTVSAHYNQVVGQTGMEQTENGIGNRLDLDNDEILENLNEVQLRNGLAPSKNLKVLDFDIEMETGTGKTYVYLRTMLEMRKNYGFSKFIIVVPSIAIKEGVYKALQITQEHFKNLYDNVVYDYFLYDSSKLEQVRSFAVSDNIQIMVINIDAFRKSFDDPDAETKANIIHRSNDKLNGMKPIELIRETRPFVIIDEPQSVDTTVNSKKAISQLNPLAIFRYSATHVEKHHPVYKIDAVDSYELELVKQIEVAAFASKDYHNNAYLKLISVDNSKSPITARIEIDASVKGKVKRTVLTVKNGDDLYEKSGGRDMYEGYLVSEIYCGEDNEYVSFSGKPDILRIGKAIGDIDDLAIKEQQIRKTIEEHLNKELMLNGRGIKVLSPFFIDRVANYRYYDEAGKPQKGIYAKLFEKHYSELIKHPKYNTLFKDIDLDTAASDVHNGYFSIDKKIKKDDGSEEYIFKETKGDEGKAKADEDAYSLIMRDKELLLSFETKLRFIFSHSALREGWDNPNVFQICTLNETNSEVKKRQEIGRGMRLCVNQAGERQHGFETNTLTVMANESYEEFASKLQREYEKDQGIRFGVMETHVFANISVIKPDGNTAYLGQEKSEQLYGFFESKGYIDNKGNVQDSLRAALKNKLLEVPDEYMVVKPSIIAVCKKVSGNLNIKNNADKKPVKLNKQVFLSDDFKELWERIKYKTTYAVSFDSEVLIEKCCEELWKSLIISSAKLVYTKAKVGVTAGGVKTEETDRTTVLTTNVKEALPDVISYLQNRTNLTRKTLVEILIKSKNLHLFAKNPQRYMEDVAQTITIVMRTMLVDGIKYTKLGDTEYYAQQLFETEELFGYLERNMIASEKSVFEYVIYDSLNEESFAKSFENNTGVKLYAKLPGWFKIPTPLGTYNPDWAVVIEQDGRDKLYFVLETKSNILSDALRPHEKEQFECGNKHFEALGDSVEFKVIDDFNNFIESV